MTLKNVFVFPALRLSGKEAGEAEASSGPECGRGWDTEGQPAQAQVSAGRARWGLALPAARVG